MKKEAAVGRKKKSENQIESSGAPTASSARAAGLESGGGSTAERVRQRAHEIYERRTALGLPGDAEGDWLQAEAELGSQAAAKP
jgi:Protein of unknown function (DUF2934)